MKFMMISVFVVSVFLVKVSSVYSGELPGKEDVEGTIALCAAGTSTVVKGNLVGSIKKWLAKAEGEIELSVKELGAIIGEIEDDELKVEVFKLYHQCVANGLDVFLKNRQQEITNNTTNNTSVGVVNQTVNGGNVQNFSGEVNGGVVINNGQ